MTDPKPPSLPNPSLLGFMGDEAHGWTRRLHDRHVHFRLLQTLDDLIHAERLQEDVFHVSERDMLSASSLLTALDTGGAVIAAFLPENPDRAVGVTIGWGGYLGRPRIVSDYLIVAPEARGLGLATELKRLQAALALTRGFAEIVWTVDPLRAANARLNFGKLGASARAYEIDRYGSAFAVALYGGLPTDRLHVTWEIATPRVISRLLGKPADTELPSEIIPFAPGIPADLVLVSMPPDIDALSARDPASALAWRLRLREILPRAFAEGFAIVDFRPAQPDAGPALVLRRERMPRA